MLRTHKQKVAILYADTGGGHRSAAQAIAQGIQLAYPDLYDVTFVNNFRDWPFPFCYAEDIYPPMVNHARLVYQAAFRASNHQSVTTMVRRLYEPLSEKLAAEMLLQFPADLYISVHPLYNQVLPTAILQSGSRAKYVSVVTDLVSGHSQWFNGHVHRYIVPTHVAFDQAVQYGIPGDRIRIAGQPVWPDFQKRLRLGGQTRESLGLDPDIPVALLVGGGDGMGRLQSLAKTIATSKLRMQLIVVCGRNLQALQVLDSVKPKIPALRVFGFVNNIPELMGASDFLITKAGPGTICEGFIAGLPIILYDAIPGQEEGNVTLVETHGAGFYCKTTSSVLRQLSNWLNDTTALNSARRASASMGQPNAAIDIAILCVETIRS